MSCPPKYRAMGSFCKYFHGLKTAPFVTLFIGGNHEASHFLRDLYFGGWVAPNIYFMGESGVLDVKIGEFDVVTIGGISGIEGKNRNIYQKGYFETFPFNDSTLRSVYHYREFEIQKFELYS
jgi:lariat debranching enzyme